MLTRKRAAGLTKDVEASLYKNEGESLIYLFDLPQEIFHKIVGEYLYLCELVAFDNSVCNKADRIKYLALLANVTMMGEIIYIRTISELEWIYRRQLRLERVEIKQKIGKDISLLKFPLYWPSIKEWEVSCGPDVRARLIADCLLQCTSLETLEIDLEDFSENDYDDSDSDDDEADAVGIDIDANVGDSDSDDDEADDVGIDIFANDGDSESDEYSRFDGTYSRNILCIFDNATFCSHLRRVHFMTNSEKICVEGVIAVTKHCRNLSSVEFYSMFAPTALVMEFFRVCGATLETFSLGVQDQDATTMIQDPFTKYRLPDVFQYCPRLKSITLNSQSSTNEALIEIGRYCPDIIELSIDCPDPSFTDNALVALFEGCRKLKDLRLMGPNENNIASSITDRAIIRASECCPNLTSVSLICLPNLTVKSLESLAINCPLIEELCFHNLMISNRDLHQFSTQYSFPNLRRFHSCYNQLSDRFLLELVQKSPLLNDLYIDFELGDTSLAIFNAGMQYIATHCRNLRRLSLCGLSGVTDPAPLIDIVTNNPRLNKDNFSFMPVLGVKAPKIVADYDYCHDIVYTKQLEALLNSRIYPRG